MLSAGQKSICTGDDGIPLPSPSVCEQKQVVCTTPSTTKTTLALMQEEFCSGFHTIQDGFRRCDMSKQEVSRPT